MASFTSKQKQGRIIITKIWNSNQKAVKATDMQTGLFCLCKNSVQTQLNNEDKKYGTK